MDRQVPASAAAVVIVVNTIGLMATAVLGLRGRGPSARTLAVHHVTGDALNMTLIAITVDPSATRALWVLTLVAVGEAGALRGGRAAMITFAGVMGAIGAALLATQGVTTAALGRWALIVFLGGGPSSVLAVQATLLRDALARTERARDQLHDTAQRDDLTGLLNRRGLRQVVDAVGGAGATLFLDLDRFKQVNDSLGHDAGDAVLRTVAHRLRNGVRDDDVVARLSGDEFAVVVADEATDLAALTERLRRALLAPIEVQDGIQVTIGVSIGVARSDDGVRGPLMRLLDAADAAMYLEKEAHRTAPDRVDVSLTETRRRASD